MPEAKSENEPMTLAPMQLAAPLLTSGIGADETELTTLSPMQSAGSGDREIYYCRGEASAQLGGVEEPLSDDRPRIDAKKLLEERRHADAQRIVEEMWTTARSEPLTMASLRAFGFVDRERYRKRVGDVVLELTLDADTRTGYWSYELAILDANGGQLDDDIVRYWLQAFFGRESYSAARRDFLMTGEARFTFPYTYGRSV